MSTAVEHRTMTLKEWAVVIKALDEGTQVLLLRKGGISEPTGAFRVEHDEFFFFPSYEHQKAHLIKPQFQADLQAVLQHWQPGTDRLSITHFARVTEVLQIWGEDAVHKLSPHYIYTENYAQERLHWNPSAPLYVVLVRVYRLPEPQVIAVRPEYHGCTSWIPVAADLNTAGGVPVLSDQAYAGRVAAVKAALAG